MCKCLTVPKTLTGILCYNNPLSYVDPDGELAWFVPVIIGAAIGAYTGGTIAEGTADPTMWAWDGGTWAGIGIGATIGGLSGGAASGITALGGGASLAGAGAGFVSGAGFTGMATDWDAGAMIKGGLIGAAAGFVSGGVASAIGGPGGAFAGGFASDVTSQFLGTGEVDLGRSLIAGGISFGMYHGFQYAQWKWGGGNNIGGLDVTYRQFSKINTAYQRSQFWRREYGVYLNRNGSARFTPRNDRYFDHVVFDDWQRGDFATAHIHHRKGGSEWVNIGGAGKWRRYNSSKAYPAGSYMIEAAGGYHSPDDMINLAGTNSLVIGRNGSSYYYNIGNNPYTLRASDPFVRFFLFPWLW